MQSQKFEREATLSRSNSPLTGETKAYEIILCVCVCVCVCV